MFSLISELGCVPEKYANKFEDVALALDTISSIALLVIGTLILSGTIHMSPTVANAMLPIGGLQAFPFIMASVSFLHDRRKNAS